MSRYYRTILATLGKKNPDFQILVKTDNAGTSGSDQFTIPTTGGGYNYDVDWGDSTTSSGVTGNITHTFPSAGNYVVKITGSFPRIVFNNTGDRLKLLEVQNWGIYGIGGTNQNAAFYGCANMTISATDAPKLSTTTALSSFLRGCTSFNQLINHWDVSNVSSFSLMFEGCTIFNQPLNNWNVSSATNMSSMFENATAFNGDISSWNVSSVTNFSRMFIFSSAFNQNIGGWNVSAATNMSQMFSFSTNFNQNIGSWNIANVTNFTNFMQGKTNANYSAANLDAIYNGWSVLSVQPNLTINFNTIKYTAAGTAGRNILTGAPNNWTILDGGI
jgi:surface protein